MGEVQGRRWGVAMSDDALAACRADVELGPREQLAQDVADLLAEVDTLRWMIRMMREAVRHG